MSKNASIIKEEIGLYPLILIQNQFTPDELADGEETSTRNMKSGLVDIWAH